MLHRMVVKSKSGLDGVALRLVLALGLVLGFAAAAQAPAAEEPPSGDQSSPAEGEGSGTGGESGEEEELKGDVLRLRDGMLMSDVQILRTTTSHYIVEVIPEVEPLEIPRSMVESIEYDDYDPVRARRREEMMPDKKEESLISGKALASELVEKLRSPVGGEPIQFENQPVEEVLAELANRTGVKLTVHESVKRIPAANRRWTLDASPDTTLIDLLQHKLLKQFQNLDIVFEYDTIRIMTQKAIQQQNNGGQGNQQQQQQQPGGGNQQQENPLQQLNNIRNNN